MLITGSNFHLIPQVKQLSFAFSNINLPGTGIAEIGISGSGIVKFRFANNKIYNESGGFIGVYDSNSNTNISGDLNTGHYSYYIDGDLIVSKLSRSTENYSKFFVNVTGATLNADIYLKSNAIPITVTIPTGFVSLSNLTGTLQNSSENSFYIYDIFTQSLQRDVPLFSGTYSGMVQSGTTVNFALNDANDSLFDDTLDFLLGFNTSLGQITGLYTSNRVSGLDIIETNLINDYSGVSISMLFDGSGTNINKFNYVNSPASKILTYEIFSTDLRGDSQDKTINVLFEAVSPLSGAYYSGNYVTGFSLTSSGEYLYPPTAQFTGYYYVSGLTYNLHSLLLNSGCTGIVPVLFTGNYGAKASGFLTSSKVYLQDVYNAGIKYYYIPTAFTMITGGTGYLSPAQASLNTGIYSNCYDVADHFGYNYLIYKPFSAYGDMASQANYLTGIVLTVTGLVNGGTQTGYLVTGLDITNPGFGYNINAFPKMSFLRSGLDGLTSNATGVFTIKQSGLYDFTSHWTVKTGISNTSLVVLASGTSGATNLSSEHNYLTAQVSLSGKDHTEPLVGKLTISTADGQSVYNLISGIREYNSTTGFLKKKNILEALKIPASYDLNFLLSQEDLDVFYSSEQYKTNFTITLGDLDF